jgi:hypothetical protein
MISDDSELEFCPISFNFVISHFHFGTIQNFAAELWNLEFWKF